MIEKAIDGRRYNLLNFVGFGDGLNWVYDRNITHCERNVFRSSAIDTATEETTHAARRAMKKRVIDTASIIVRSYPDACHGAPAMKR